MKTNHIEAEITVTMRNGNFTVLSFDDIKEANDYYYSRIQDSRVEKIEYNILEIHTLDSDARYFRETISKEIVFDKSGKKEIED